ncbi:MAG: protein kinase [Gammaproteobacteria bacterium]|nr:protein kinase [Gammaproteobacteria bacterium]
MASFRKLPKLNLFMRKEFWISRGMLIALMALAFLLLAGQAPVRKLDESFYRLAATYGPTPRVSKDVVVVKMDPRSRSEWGNHLPRQVLMDAIKKLQDNRVAVIGLMADLQGQQEGLAQKRLQAIEDLKLEKALAKRNGQLSRRYESRLKALKSALDSDQLLLKELKRGNRTIAVYTSLPRHGESAANINKSERLSGVKQGDALRATLPGWLLGNELPQINLLALPDEQYRDSVSLGMYEPNSAQQSLVYEHKGQYYPSFALRVAASYMRVRPNRVELLGDRGINLASHTIRTDDRFRVYPAYYPNGVTSIGIKSLLDGKVRSSSLRNKIVLLESDFTVPGITLPNGRQVSAVEAQAQLISSLLNKDLYAMPFVSRLIQWGGLLLVALYLWLFLPRVSIRTAFWLTSGIVVAAVVAEWSLLVLSKTWLPLAVPAAMLLLGYLLLSGRQFRRYWTFMVRAQTGANEAYRRLGQVQSQQGSLDEAFSSLRNCQASETVLETLYDLGMAYERKRQYNKASAVFAYIQEHEFNYRDVKERIKRMQEMENAAARGMTQGPAATMIISGGGMQNPQLGRYEVESMLGQGAMGTVYLAKDPAIGRQVAIKTIALNAEFEASEIEEAKMRFYREAEAAGRLNHPNIVTVYDVGEEEDLAYIAMDYLPGVNLSVYTKPDHLLPIDTVLSIAEQVADALDYGHQHKVIHRDIKPGNIIYEPKSGKVSVTDFGIASLTDSSKTRTGTILGTPSYMSPEQIAGKRVDGRSDMFSLAVMVYQLLCGRLPFEGDSLAALMFKITNEKHQSIKRVRPELPACISTILNKAMQKEVDKRFASTGQMAKELHKCREQA